MEKQNSNAIHKELKTFIDENLNVNIDDSSIALSQWYLSDRTHIDNVSAKIETQGGGKLLYTTRQRLDKSTIVAGKSLNYRNNENFLCVIKEIYLYNERQLNDNDYIIKFHGYSIQDCRCTMFYDYAQRGDLFEYFQKNHNENLLKEWKNRIKLAWDISKGVNQLHNVSIFFNVLYILLFVKIIKIKVYLIK